MTRVPYAIARVACDARVQLGLAAVAVVLAVSLGVAWGRRSWRQGTRPARQWPALPEARPIWDAWRAAWDGNVEGHLACFAPPARQRLEAELAASGREGFGRELRRRAEAALAIELGPPGRRSRGQLLFPVTVQHARDAACFDYRVVQDGGVWKIAEIVPRGRKVVDPPYGERLAPPAEEGDER